MYRCPKCGRGMTNHMAPSYREGARVVWTCICGYSSDTSSYYWDDHVTPKKEEQVSADSVPLVEKKKKR